MSANPLLDDFLAEQHNHLLEAGNLKRKPPVVAPFIPQWQFLRNRARYTHTVCGFCSAETRTLIGLFRVEANPQSATRETAIPLTSDTPRTLQNFPLDHVTLRATVPFCASCLPILFPQP